ncbi:MAG: glycosyltransferase family 4 protein [Erythrobacter sp.]
MTRALTLFEMPDLASRAASQIVSVDPTSVLAPVLDHDLIVDHIALSWKRLAFMASLRARNLSARIVHVEHSYTKGFEANQVTAKGRFRTMLRIASLLVDQFVCVSDAQRHWLRDEVGVPANKLQTIHPWSGRFELESIPSAKPLARGPLRLLAYGRFADVKNFAELLKAMKYFSADDVELTLFGDGPSRDGLLGLAKHLPNVSIEPATNDISQYLENCDAVIIPSRYEAFGLVATEARLAGRAVIAADIDGLPEQVGAAGIFTRLDTDKDIVAAICWALRAPLAEMGQLGRQEVAEQHAVIIQDWLAVFKLAGAQDTLSCEEKSQLVSAQA